MGVEPDMVLNERDLDSAIPLWTELAGSSGRLVNQSENHTFRFDSPRGAVFMLRVHRPDYQSLANIESELAWLKALHEGTDLPVPHPVVGRDGMLLQHFRTASGQLRHAVLFRFIAGSEPSLDEDLVGLFGTLGHYSALLHMQTIGWPLPAGFTRQQWNAATILDADGLWGDWRIAPGVDAAVRSVLHRLDARLRQDLAEYGQSASRYGLIHADMRLGNILVDGAKVSLIDFDDCGFCWFVYDFAASVSFHETHEAVPALKQAWIDSYRRVRALEPADIAAIDTMVMLRRMALLAWMGSHYETRLAQTHIEGYARGSADLAERYLSGGLWR